MAQGGAECGKGPPETRARPPIVDVWPEQGRQLVSGMGLAWPARQIGQEGLRLLARAGKEDHRARYPA
jgi:hypothetical protein